MNDKLLQVKQLLSKYNQEHVLDFLNGLNNSDKDNLIEQILRIDFDQLYSVLDETGQCEFNHNSVQPLDYQRLDDLTNEQREMYTNEGWRLIRNGKVGVIVVAGGQGARLGHDGPKGSLDIGLPSGKSLFQLQAERLLNLSNRAGKNIPWYIMTSPDNYNATVMFFQKHDFFGYPEEDCIFFQQKTMPALNQERKLLFSEPSQINLVPSGNGECFYSLYESGAFADIKHRGITWLFYYNVDNALIKVADPLFIGYSAIHNNPIAIKVTEKCNVEEKVGVLCSSNGRPSVLEYNEIPESLLEKRDSQSKLLLNLANISIHMFRYDFIENFIHYQIPYHIALKKITYVDSKGCVINPSEPNAYKLERFIFDYFPLAEQVTVLMVEREEEFAPVKNREGQDSPFTARNQILNLHKKWIENCGAKILESGENRLIEVSPLISYSGEGLHDNIEKITTEIEENYD
ncbi:UDPGP type 1 family protein [Paenibacillus albiflavus]|uniref:UDPGP type 1 family protein n=1 Tax=Paenibacillus albiflavus TaxID=2545760 RepID=A0A4R4EML5_9BACL|nr:UDPGP type 1 family protein [Paenibacillus albiflavus]TCZ81087.1 UDPGP type 1 family protein [Paenibacillus albiflavus]